MDECTKLFNVVYKVLMDHHLIRADHDEEKKKQDASAVCIPLLKNFVEHNDTDLHQWLSKLLVQLDISVNDKENLNEVFSMILLEIQNLKDRLTKQESKIQSQELRIQSQELRIQTLELNQQMQATNSKAFEIARLFRFYFFDDIIKGVCSTIDTWGKLTNEWSLREHKVMELLKIDRKFVDPKEDLNVQNHPHVRTLIEPVENVIKNTTLLEIKLIDLRKMGIYRYQYVHMPIRSIAEQRDIITNCLNHIYPVDYEYVPMLKNMALKIAELDQDVTQTK